MVELLERLKSTIAAVAEEVVVVAPQSMISKAFAQHFSSHCVKVVEAEEAVELAIGFAGCCTMVGRLTH